MHHEVLMSKLHRLANLQKQFKPIRYRQILPFAVAMDGHAIDEFHHQIRIPALGDSAVQKARDVGVLKSG